MNRVTGGCVVPALYGVYTCDRLESSTRGQGVREIRKG